METSFFKDAVDYAVDAEDRKSTTGVIFSVNGSPVSWFSKKTCVSLSSLEAEYIALCDSTKQAVWIRRFLLELANQRGGLKAFLAKSVMFSVSLSFMLIGGMDSQNTADTGAVV